MKAKNPSHSKFPVQISAISVTSTFYCHLVLFSIHNGTVLQPQGCYRNKNKQRFGKIHVTGAYSASLAQIVWVMFFFEHAFFLDFPVGPHLRKQSRNTVFCLLKFLCPLRINWIEFFKKIQINIEKKAGRQEKRVSKTDIREIKLIVPFRDVDHMSLWVPTVTVRKRGIYSDRFVGVQVQERF